MTETAQGFGHHDHLCWVYDEPDELYSPVMEFLADGLAQGQRVCYATSGDTAQWSEHLQDLDAHNRLGQKDATQLVRLGELYPGEMVEPTRQLRAFAATLEDALAAGFTACALRPMPHRSCGPRSSVMPSPAGNPWPTGT